MNPVTAARQASLSITNSWSLLQFMSIKSVMPSNHLIFCCPLLLLCSIFPSIRIFSNESVLCIRWPKYWVSASASVLPKNIQDWFPLGLTGLIFDLVDPLKMCRWLVFHNPHFENHWGRGSPFLHLWLALKKQRTRALITARLCQSSVVHWHHSLNVEDKDKLSNLGNLSIVYCFLILVQPS